MKKDKIIYFKNGNNILISQEVANTLRDRIIQGCPNYQCFTSDDGDCDIIIKVTIYYFTPQLNR